VIVIVVMQCLIPSFANQKKKGSFESDPSKKENRNKEKTKSNQRINPRKKEKRNETQSKEYLL